MIKIYKFGCFGILMMVSLLTNPLKSQEDYIFTKSFTEKLDRYGIEFYYPVERWLKASPLIEDEYMKYDLVLHSPPDIEVRIDIDPDQSHLFPNIEIQRSLAHIASNDQDEYIEITQFPKKYAMNNYGADLALFADFTPKESFSEYPNGRMLCLYREGRVLVKFIVLFEKELHPYFRMPMKLKSKSENGM